jgi:glycyl-tRNA synthetase
MSTFQEILRKLAFFWEQQGCIIHQGYDLEVGAGTSNPATFLRALGPEPYRAAYIEPCRRPGDGRYGTNPTRMQHYFQYQVILKPAPANIQDLYLQSLTAIGFDLSKHDIRFVHDDWENPTLGAWGLGWEVWMDGMEVSQFTYFQSVGGVSLKPITGEITYGIERLSLYLQKANSIFDLQWNEHLTYGDVYHRNEIEWSHYNFEHASTEMWFRHFEDFEKEARALIKEKFPVPAYDFVIKCSHAFNMLDARGVISVTERTGYIARIRELARQVAELYIESRQAQGFPLLGRFPKDDDTAKGTVPPIPEALLNDNTGSREDFVLEIGSEELPASFVPIGCRNLEKEIRQFLDKEAIPYESIDMHGTPRRITAYVRGLALSKPSQKTEKRGPAADQAFNTDGSLKPAGEGFFRSLGKETLSLQAIREGKDPGVFIRSLKGMDYLFSISETPALPTAQLLAKELPEIILRLDFPKKMRWGNLDITYARPLRWILALFGRYSIPLVVGNTQSGDYSYGHSQLDPRRITLEKAQDYFVQLREHKVLVDIKERQKSILDQLAEIESKLQVNVLSKEQVIPQVLFLVEWPYLTVASFDEKFLVAPKEVLISEMVEHQKYFPVCTSDGKLKNLFIITANTVPTDQIREGNQRALSPRLNDGVFLFEQGLKHPLEKFNEKLRLVTYQKELGSMHDKVERLMSHSRTLQQTLGISDPLKATRAALLCKADLASEMVYEFPELQGIIGKYYALAHQEDPEVAQAIEEHWLPKGEQGALPETPTGILLALADKFDNLLGCFLIGLKPTSSSDPYALRRQTLGIIKILIQGRYHLPLRETLRQCLDAFPSKNKEKQNLDVILGEIESFIINRIKTVFLEYGFAKDEIEAGISSGCNDIYDAFCKVSALHQFRKNDSRFYLLYEVYRRAKGQLAGQALNGAFKPELLIENAEKDLDGVLTQTDTLFIEAISKHEYAHAYELIAGLQPPLAKLFEEVKILDNDPHLKSNRIALLKRVFGLFDLLLDFSKIQA